MATEHSAQISIMNQTDGVAYIQLFHQNSSNGTQNGSWVAQPGKTVGPMTVKFETGGLSSPILDYWAVVMAVEGGKAPGIYQNNGTWKECQLQSKDVKQDITLTVSTTKFDVNLPSGGCSDGMTRLVNQFNKITNVFVLMLENRSFDNIFGQSGIAGITHARPENSNSYNGSTYAVSSPAPTTMTTDPGHEFLDVVEQLCGPGQVYSPGSYPLINNSGYAASYATTTDEGSKVTPTSGHIGDIMKGFDTPTQLPVIYKLAKSFAICDNWFSSLPGPTWPNRFFLHGASSAGLDDSPSQADMILWETKPDYPWERGFQLPKGSIFDALSKAKIGWRLYNDDTNAYSDNPCPLPVGFAGAIPQVTSLENITLLNTNSLTHFASDLQAPYTSQYTFIEPHYGNIIDNSYHGGSSQHPMDDVYGGEALIKAVYEAIQSSPVWKTSLLIVTYDEHGGYYDSVTPPPAPPPNDGGNQYNKHGFTFNRYGVRVPAVVASPWIPQGHVDHTVYDHTSVLATLEHLFGLQPLTDRDKKANSLLALLTESAPRHDTPTSLPHPAPAVSRPAPPSALTPEALAEQQAQPIDEKGNLPGFLAAALGTELELTKPDEAGREALIAEYAAISTKGQAAAAIARVVALADTVKAGGPTSKSRSGGAATPVAGAR